MTHYLFFRRSHIAPNIASLRAQAVSGFVARRCAVAVSKTMAGRRVTHGRSRGRGCTVAAEVHAWEAPERQWAYALDDWATQPDAEAEYDYHSMNRQEAAWFLYETIVDAKLANQISAKTACIMAYFAVKGGCDQSESLCKIGLPPDKQSGKYSARFDKVVGHPQEEGYDYVSVPINQRNAGQRIVKDLPTVPVHEALRNYWIENKDKVQEQFAAKRWPRCYYKHTVCTSALPGEFVWSYAIYLDGVKFTREDTVLGIWLICLCTDKRWLVSVLRKTEYCNCGCRGFCSLYPLFVQLSGGMRALASGRYPAIAANGDKLAADRLAFAGDPLGFKGACLFVKGDWMEFATTLCFPTWASHGHPCMLCDCTLDVAYLLMGVGVLGLPWVRHRLEWYDAECAGCEIHVQLSDDEYREVRAALIYDKRRDGSRGRALALDVPSLGLIAGDRLEPSNAVPDVGEGFDDHNPGSAVFWRIITPVYASLDHPNRRTEE